MKHFYYTAYECLISINNNIITYTVQYTPKKKIHKVVYHLTFNESIVN